MNAPQLPGVTTSESLDRLLSLAERIRKDVDNGRTKARNLLIAAVSMALASILAFAIAAVDSSPFLSQAGPSVTVPGLGILAVLFAGGVMFPMAALSYPEVSRKYRQDRWALSEALNLLHEQSQLIGQYVGLSPVEEIEFRIRLIRLGDVPVEPISRRHTG